MTTADEDKAIAQWLAEVEKADKLSQRKSKPKWFDDAYLDADYAKPASWFNYETGE
jgi:hypothetical protein